MEVWSITYLGLGSGQYITNPYSFTNINIKLNKKKKSMVSVGLRPPRSSRCIAMGIGRDEDSDIGSDHQHQHQHLSLSPLSKDTAMGLVLNAVTGGKGWTTGSGMEGPSASHTHSTSTPISTFPWSLFTKSPRRRMLISFTCNICSQRTSRAINPHAYTDGTVFVQCCGCNAYHKLVDNLNLFDGMKCYITSTFNYGQTAGDVDFQYQDIQDTDDDGVLGI